MLTALELIGFKSFADRTRFEFPSGITVIVGPNGSGKSNIVDAIRWVLGTQSARSLRGHEMSDVIFKGSATRRPAGAAEATLVFSNEQRQWPIDADEVRLTRRVYRSGEGEYLINGQPCRLKDVKDLIRGSGIGGDTYSLIEQGKVDRLLQANPRERRAIFEEAAGVSRFYAKKVEAERRLVRVQQNLLRLGDIVDEVAARLQNLRSQASKAERYQRLADRMRAVRTDLAWTDWVHLTSSLQAAADQSRLAHEKWLASQESARTTVQARQAAELELQELASQASAIDQKLNELAVREAEYQAEQRMTGERRTPALAQARSELSRCRLLRQSTAEMQAAYEQTKASVREATATFALRAAAAEQAGQRELQLRERQAALQAEVERLRGLHHATLQRRTELEGEQDRLRNRLANDRTLLEELAQRSEQVQQRASEEAQAAEQAGRVAKTAAAAADEVAARLNQLRGELVAARRELLRGQAEAAALQGRLQGLQERIDVLESLERRGEGVASGVRAVLELARSPNAGPLGSVRGMVAELLAADVPIAPLIDVALGPLAQYLVVTDGRLVEEIEAGRLPLTHRVGVLRLDQIPPRRPGDRLRLDGLKGVLGRADRLVRTTPELQDLARHLLGTTWIVDSLSVALGLHKLSGAGLRFVTKHCELLDRDGSLMLGPIQAAAGLVSRRSELQAAREEWEQTRLTGEQQSARLQQLTIAVEHQDQGLTQLEAEHSQRLAERADAMGRSQALATQAQATARDSQQLLRQLELSRVQETQHRERLEQLAHQLRESQEQLAGLTTALEQSATALQEQTNAWQASNADLVQARVAAAASEQHRKQVQLELSQMEHDQVQRTVAWDESHARIQSARRDLHRLRDRSSQVRLQLSTLAQQRDALKGEHLGLAQQLVGRRQEVARAVRDAERLTSEVASCQTQYLQAEAHRDAQQLHLDTLAQRTLEDLNLDLTQATPAEGWQPVNDRAQAERELASLRDQLARTGAVNLEALREVDELQERYDGLHAQYQDLTAAKASLDRIIARINSDSRRLFLDTLEAIRENFRVLYRKSFGGGTADLVLEEGVDPLEAGVEIVATPPGKPSFANSLLSGGERALTAVALLMAIFQYRPSPFCILDEVDAPFDEANIGRFIGVLNEFLGQTKFVIVTHSKKTMTAATTLYGVTMQESGVSMQVSVRFEDVAEDGQIASAALARAAQAS